MSQCPLLLPIEGREEAHGLGEQLGGGAILKDPALAHHDHLQDDHVNHNDDDMTWHDDDINGLPDRSAGPGRGGGSLSPVG